MMTVTRRLAAILAADVVGYSRLMGADEAGTAHAVREHPEAAAPIVASRQVGLGCDACVSPTTLPRKNECGVSISDKLHYTDDFAISPQGPGAILSYRRHSGDRPAACRMAPRCAHGARRRHRTWRPGPGDLNNPGFGLHPMKGKRKGQWSVWISGNWRLVFEFAGSDVSNVDLVDYH
jgi:hypothetical protein